MKIKENTAKILGKIANIMIDIGDAIVFVSIIIYLFFDINTMTIKGMLWIIILQLILIRIYVKQRG